VNSEPMNAGEILKLNTMALLGSWLARLWFGSARVRILNRNVYDEYLVGDPRKGNVVVGTWHRNCIFLYYFFRKFKDMLIMGSRSRDGELAVRLGTRVGINFIRGSSSLGGSDALQGMIEYMNKEGKGKLCTFPVDGPRGPARKLKKGMLILAKETNSFFVPVTCSGNRLITFSKAWDKTIFPYPFSRMVIDFHQPFKISPDISEVELEKLRQEVEDILNELTDRVDRLCGYTG